MKHSVALVVFLLFSPLLLGQEGEHTSGVELPDFVITGKEAVDFTPLTKEKAPLVASLSREFLAPQVAPSELRIRELSDPVRQGAQILTPDTFFTSRVMVTGGNISLPVVSASWGMQLPNTFFTLKAAGENRRAFVQDADGFSAAPALSFLYYNPLDASFLPGMKLGADVSFTTESWKFYGSAVPTQKRTASHLHLQPQILVPLTSDFFFTAATEISRFNLLEEKYNQNRIALKGTLRYSGGWLLVKANAEAGSYSVTNTAGKDYLRVEGTGGFWISDVMFLSGGVQVMQLGGLNKTNPGAALRVNVTRALVAEFFMDRFTALLDNRWFHARNRYIKTPLAEPVLSQKDISLGGLLSYEMEHVFEVHASAAFTKYRSFASVKENASAGFFDAAMIKASGIESQVTVLSIPGRYGWFAGTAGFRFLKDEPGNRVPYEPLFNLSAAYGYPLTKELTLQPSLEYTPSVYTNAANTAEVPSALLVNLDAYWFAGGNTELLLSVENLLNAGRYYAQGYKSPGITIQGGIRARW